MQRAQAGDTSAYDELVRKHQERIYATLYHMTANHEYANDLVQEAMLNVWRRASYFDPGRAGVQAMWRMAYRVRALAENAPEELSRLSKPPSEYFRSNLLSREVLARDVAEDFNSGFRKVSLWGRA